MPTRKAQYFEAAMLAPQDTTTRLYALPVRYVPMMLSALETRKGRSFWDSEADFIRGYEVITEMQIMLLQPSIDSQMIVEAIDRLYTLSAQALNGTVHNAILQPDNTYTYNPPLPQGSPTLQDDIGSGAGLRRQLLNSQGLVNTGWFDGAARPATLADLAQAARLNGEEDEGVIPNAIEEILLAVSNGSTVADAVSQFLGSAANIATDGGLAAVQIGTTGLLATQIGALAIALDQLQTIQETILERLSYLTGDTPPTNATIGENGLPSWLSAGFGSLTELNGEGTYLLQRLGIIGDVIASQTLPLEQTATATNTQLPIIATRLAQLLGIEGVTDPIVASSLLALAECICNNTQQIADNTAPPEVPPPGSLNLEPDINCEGFSELVRVRCSNWNKYAETNDGEGELYFTTFEGFGDAVGMNALVLGNTSIGSLIGYEVTDGYSLEYCASWNTEGYTTELIYFRPNGETANAAFNAALPQFTSLPSGVSNENEQNSFSNAHNLDFVGSYYVCFTAEVPLGSPPPTRDLWLSWIVTPNPV